MQLRPAKLCDQAQILELYRETFPPEESDLVAQLAIDLLPSPEADSIIVESDNCICGHIAFSPLTLAEDPKYRATVLAPLAVAPKNQKQGVGSQLVQYGLAQYKQAGIHDLYLYGDPNYYGRFGFAEVSTKNIEAPYPLSYPFGWQRLKLNEHQTISGKLTCVEALQKPELW